MGRKKVTIEEINKEFKTYFDNVLMIEFDGVSKPCKILIADEVKEYSKASKVIDDLKKVVKGTYNGKLIKHNEIIIKNEFKKIESINIYHVPTLEEIKNILGNEFTLQDLKREYKEFKILSLSTIMDNYRRENKINMIYEKANDKYITKYKIVS